MSWGLWQALPYTHGWQISAALTYDGHCTVTSFMRFPAQPVVRSDVSCHFSACGAFSPLKMRYYPNVCILICRSKNESRPFSRSYSMTPRTLSKRGQIIAFCESGTRRAACANPQKYRSVRGGYLLPGLALLSGEPAAVPTAPAASPAAPSPPPPRRSARSRPCLRPRRNLARRGRRKVR